jgi:hypothetical protein
MWVEQDFDNTLTDIEQEIYPSISLKEIEAFRSVLPA